MNKARSSTFSLTMLAMLVIGLYLTNLYSYLLFHTLAELFSIIIGGTLFVIAWNSRGFARQTFDYLTFIGIAYLFVSILDLLHTLGFKGMPIFTGYDYYANQFWVCARFLEAVSLLVPFLFLRRKRALPVHRIFAAYALVTGALIASILYFRVFPVAFVEGQGQTAFKVASEIVVIVILAVAANLMHRNRDRLAPAIYRKLLLSVLFTILSELAFTVYVDNYDILNLLGHVFKIVSFYLIYQAIVITCITEPYASIFKELTEKEEMLRQAAMTDELTGLHNRHFLDTVSAAAMEQADRYDEPLSMAIVDLDHFKRVNDTWGHPAGDEVLRCVARAMSESIRAADTLVRFGGEEFVILMPKTDLEGAVQAGEKVRSAIGGARLPVSGVHTASIGVAERLPAESFRNWYKRADIALYQAKQSGRNRVVAAGEQSLACMPAPESSASV